MFGGLTLETAHPRRRRVDAPQCGQTGVPMGGMYFWLYTYYLSKYYELFDTPLQLARGKVRNFGFQVYHHALVLFWRGAGSVHQSLWQIGMLFNTAVARHCFLLDAHGRPRKRLVTRFQIVQFVTSVLYSRGPRT